MATRATKRWIRTFANAFKQSSFQDKMEAMRAEPNPYYLLEWLIVERTEEDEAFWSVWEGERTPGLEKGSRIGIESCFRDQLLPELWIGEAMSDERRALLALAFADLEKLYGAEAWEDGLVRLRDRAERTIERFGAFQTELAAETAKLERELERERRELREEAESYEAGDFDLEAELRAAAAKGERKKLELPGKLLQRLFPDDALLRLAALSGLPNPAERLRLAAKELAAAHRPALEWLSALEASDLPALLRLAERRGGRPAEGMGWFASYMNRSELTRGWLPTEERQRRALRWIAAAPDDAWLAAAFRAAGWEERLAEPEFAEAALHRFVWFAAADEEKRKRLREETVLQRWNDFAERFAKEDPSRFEALSWVFVLDPESVQQRLLRVGTGLQADELIRKLCRLYGEGIRRGLDVNVLVSLYTYLAKHDKESFYSFVHGMKRLAEALPMLALPAATMSMLFRGDGVRQTAARKALLQLFYEYMEEEANERLAAGTAEALGKLAAILAYDKRAAVVGWLQRHERDWRRSIDDDEERAFTRLLRFRWIGTSPDAAEQHRAVKEWLQRHSDWVVFETDAPNVDAAGVSYRIVKPGAIDAETGELLCRAVVRAEWADRAAANRLLDDLKLL